MNRLVLLAVVVCIVGLPLTGCTITGTPTSGAVSEDEYFELLGGWMDEEGRIYDQMLADARVSEFSKMSVRQQEYTALLAEESGVQPPASLAQLHAELMASQRQQKEMAAAFEAGDTGALTAAAYAAQEAIGRYNAELQRVLPAE